jgi:hypothetical protein
MSTNPIASITEWMDGAGHGPESLPLYFALTLEEGGQEMLDPVSLLHPNDRVEPTERLGLMLKNLSRMIRNGDVRLDVANRAELLDAALDTAWVALCLARTLTGDRLGEAWAELHRSNVTDKQQDGVFVKDASGKVCKPNGYRGPNFAQFLLAAKTS